MRRAISRDFASVPGVRVVSTLDARLPVEDSPGLDVRIIADGQEHWFESLASEADYTVLIAPESDGVLAELSRVIRRVGGRSLGSSPRVVDVVGDKLRMAYHFHLNDIPSPSTRTVKPQRQILWRDWDGPIVVKPRYGAGSVDTVVVRDRRSPAWVQSGRPAVAQRFLSGEPMSASFLIDCEGRVNLLAVGRQRIEVDPEGRILYRGGTIPAARSDCPPVVATAVASVVGADRYPGLRGFVGVDFLLDDRGEAVVLEINPRPTTSFVGLARLLPPGTIAGAWLAASAGSLKGTEWPDRLRAAREGPAISFDADGSIHLEGFPP
jgi:tyramine---L-glutamate ligase